MNLLLAGDIGGTNTRLRLADSQSEGLSPLYESNFVNSSFSDLVSIVQPFLAEAAKKLGDSPAPEKACFAVAGPVTDNACTLTNLGWKELKGQELEQKLKIPRVALINDFAAVGYGVSQLDKKNSKDLVILQKGTYQEDAPIAVIGAGTGLGEAFVIQGKVYPTEGGHIDFASRTQDEFDLLKYLKAKYNLERVSVERVVSGPGIVNIYQFLRDEKHLKESPGILANMSSGDPAEAIAQAALNQSDPLCEKAMQMFKEAYASEVGNFALKLLPYGGLYVAGGIAPKILQEKILQESFLRELKKKGRMETLIEKIPLYLVNNEKVGLIGAAHYAERL
jgi:glucokinase